MSWKPATILRRMKTAAEKAKVNDDYNVTCMVCRKKRHDGVYCCPRCWDMVHDVLREIGVDMNNRQTYRVAAADVIYALRTDPEILYSI